MTPSARVQAGIELLDLIIDAARTEGPPADRLIADYFRQRRYAGSKDRRAVRALVYGAIRECGPIPPDGRASMLRLGQSQDDLLSLFNGEGHGPQLIKQGEIPAAGGIAPGWLIEKLGESGISGQEAQALLDRAPLDIRVNTLKADRALLSLPKAAQPTAAPHGLRLESGVRIDQWEEFLSGSIEVQDTGSQLACMAVDAQPGETIVDLCAGGGGKTLALAAAMRNSGTLIAADVDRGRLARLRPRAERAGVTNIETRLLDPGRELDGLAEFGGAADAILIDAPCSGTGTWRRNPEARWRLTPDRLKQLQDLQARLLDIAANLVRPGGRLIYVTCSLLDGEGPSRIEHFLSNHSQWQRKEFALPAGRERGGGIRLTPHYDGTDGFFIACLSKT